MTVVNGIVKHILIFKKIGDYLSGVFGRIVEQNPFTLKEELGHLIELSCA